MMIPTNVWHHEAMHAVALAVTTPSPMALFTQTGDFVSVTNLTPGRDRFYTPLDLPVLVAGVCGNLMLDEVFEGADRAEILSDPLGFCLALWNKGEVGCHDGESIASIKPRPTPGQIGAVARLYMMLAMAFEKEVKILADEIRIQVEKHGKAAIKLEFVRERVLPVAAELQPLADRGELFQGKSSLANIIKFATKEVRAAAALHQERRQAVTHAGSEVAQ